MQSQNSLDKLYLLFDACEDDLVEACINNSHDLGRCISAMPNYTKKIMDNINNKNHIIGRLLSADDDPGQTLNELNV